VQNLARDERIAAGSRYAAGKTVPADALVDFLQSVVRPGDRVCIEGDNQKQADTLAVALAAVDPAKIRDLHMVQSGIILPEHLDIFEKGIARRLDYSFSGPQSSRIARLLATGKIELGAIHTYLELLARFFVETRRPFYVEPLFTRDPAAITETQILMAMLVIKGLYMPYGVRRLNHGIGFNTAAIELLLPTYGGQLGLKGRICTHWALNPHPTLIPAIEAGWVEQIHCFGSEVGMEDYIAARPDIFFTGPDGSLRSNRTLCQTAGLYACDMFIGSTLQIDLQGHSSTVTTTRVAGFGGAPNMGSDPHGR